MYNITINEQRREIVVTKKFAEAAKRFGTEEYAMLKEAKLDNPSFKVVIRKTSRKETFKGMTYEFMENYISKHDDEEGNIMKAFNTLLAKDEEAEELGAVAANYHEIKDWFLQTYPAIAAYTAKQDRILKSVKAA